VWNRGEEELKKESYGRKEVEKRLEKAEDAQVDST
jgi:hypothetical protein